MELTDITNRVHVVGQVYTPNVTLHSRFSPLIKRGRPLHEQVSRLEFPAYRSRGATNMDLWVDGGIYPADPLTSAPPTFRSLKQFLEFICLGEGGMLGYCNRLLAVGSGLERPNGELEEELRASQFQNATMTRTNAILRAQLEESQSKLQLALDSVNVQCLERERLAADFKDLERHHSELTEIVTVLGNREIELGELVRTLIESSSANRVSEMKVELEKLKKNIARAEARMNTLKEGPLGSRVRSRQFRGLDELTHAGGQAKRRRKQLRSILQPQDVDCTQQSNKDTATKKRLWGNDSTQRKTAVALARILSKREAATLIDEPRMRSVGTDIANGVLKKIGTEIGADSMLAVCDMAGVSQEAYGLVFKTMKGRVKLVDPGLTADLLPKPHKVPSVYETFHVRVKVTRRCI